MSNKSEAASLLEWAKRRASDMQRWALNGTRTVMYSAEALRDEQLKFERLATLLRALGKVTK